MEKVQVQYFALMRERAGINVEDWSISTKETVAQLYDRVRQKYDISLEFAHLRVAVNHNFAPSDYPLKHSDHVVFIPPVAGG